MDAFERVFKGLVSDKNGSTTHSTGKRLGLGFGLELGLGLGLGLE